MSSGRDSPAITEEESLSGSQYLRRTSSASSAGGPPPILRRASSARARKLSRVSSESPRYDANINNLPTINENRSADHQRNEEPSQWHAFSLLFVAVPAFCGLFFENGGAVATDAGLLGLGCLFLYWSVKWPWQWYNAARVQMYVDYDPDYLDDEQDYAAVNASSTMDEEEEKPEEEGKQSYEANSGKRRAQQVAADIQDRKKADAASSLLRYELMALFWCFAAPMAVAWLLHMLRPYLSRPSGGLVSNSNLTLFVLAAELRPVSHMFKLIDHRTMHLQKIVAAPEEDESNNDMEGQVAQILQRLEAAENRLADAPGAADRLRDSYASDKSGVSSPTSMSAAASTSATAAALAVAGSATQTFQPQLDALNRAVRRYEKRATMQSVILDARLRDLDNRVSDALSLAAAASRMSQKQGLGTWLIEVMNSMLANALKTMYSLIMLPWNMTQRAYMYLLGPRRKRRVKAKAPATRWEYERIKRISHDNH